MRIESTNRPQCETFQPSATSTPSSDTTRATAKASYTRFSTPELSSKPLITSRFNSHLSTLAKVGLVAIAVAALVPAVSAYCYEACYNPRLECTSWIETGCNWYGCWDYVVEQCEWVKDCQQVCY